MNLDISGVTKRLADFELTADFTVKPGERAALLGRSGSGKTTLLRMIAGLELPDRGSIRLGSEDLTPLAPEKRGVGMVFQDQALFPTLSVLENAAFGLQVRGVDRKDREREALTWLERVGLASRRDAAVDTLSGGERQRVAFVRAWVWKPRLLLLDEPFSALDSELRGRLRQELVKLHELWPVPLLLVTHDPADVEAVATVKIQFSESENGAKRRFSLF